ncbi:hypothetical protein ACEN2I_01760 [Flavobacterium sp. W22_SRS_FK3]|uniref:hypothetical protein n=1 Tax=Flavobacterium sp. W22_SRS_FK3 TaxID=3240275 RepID=UPI003F9392BE
MKTKLLLIAMLAIGLTSCSVQSQTTVYAKNSDISDNLDLRAVASIFGESANLQDFERRLNDPKYQISNLDLNNDEQVDYLRVIETVEDRTHVVIIQAVLDRDVYQDIATIDVERDNSNKVVVQVVGNSYLYGDNYIYEPVYNVAPVIYTSFWVTNYRPYYSTWAWNFYPTYYVAWRPYPIYRYRSNINICINVNNHYNYVNYRRSYRAPVLYETRRSYGYERQHPNYSFSQRHANVNNRYELDQRRLAGRSQNGYNGRSNSARISGNENRTANRNYAENRNTTNRSYNSNRVSLGKDNNAVRPNKNNSGRFENTQKTESRVNSENRTSRNRSISTSRVESPGNEPSRRYTQNSAPSIQRAETPRVQSSGNYTQNRSASESRSSSARPQNTQRSESPRVSQESKGGQSQRESVSGSRGGGRRG